MRAASPRPGDPFALAEGELALPVGRLDITLDRATLPAATQPITLLPADRFRIAGLKLRLRDSGLGVPLVAAPPRELFGRPDAIARPLTAFLRLAGDARDLESGLAETLEFHSGYSADFLTVNGQRYSCQSHSATIRALRRILLQHVRAVPASRP